MRPVGILGGMGPAATVELMSRVIRAVPAQDDAGHVPLLVDQNTAVPSRIARLVEGQGDDPGPVLAMMAQRLVGAGAQALAMPCNTAHHWADRVRAAGVPFLDMVALSAAAAAARAPGGRVVVLGSPALQIAAIYDAALRGAGVDHGYAHDLDLIRAVKRDGATPATRARFDRLVAGQRADVLLVACTEYSLLGAPDSRLIDTLDILVDAIVTFATGEG